MLLVTLEMVRLSSRSPKASHQEPMPARVLARRWLPISNSIIKDPFVIK